MAEVILRDMVREDIEDYVRWFTAETEWIKTDAPWENADPFDEAEERKSWTEYYESVRGEAPDAPRWKYEIEADGKHIGWVSRYFDLDYMDNPEQIPAVGIDIPDPEMRGHGFGTQALQSFLRYLTEQGYHTFYTQTWSGNQAMLKVAGKLGFRECRRKKEIGSMDGKPYDAVTLKLER